MPPVVSLDFETRSALNLGRCGVYRYAEDLSTDIICMAYSIDGGVVQGWMRNEPFPTDLRAALDAQAEMHAWNAQFERVMWRVMQGWYDAPYVPLGRWHCSAAAAAAMALPRSLGEAARTLGVTEQKDDAGHRLMLKMCAPRRDRQKNIIYPLEWRESPDDIARLLDYCKQDVRTEMAVAKHVRALPPSERETYLLDQRINDRGLRLDMPLVRAAQRVVTQGLDEANREISLISQGKIPGVTKVAAMKDYLADQGIAVPSLKKNVVAEMLAGQLPSTARAILELRADAGRTSVKKLDAMEACVCEDGKARGLLLYHGANTGRWSGKLIQPQNFARPDVKDIESYIPDMLTADALERISLLAPPLAVVSSMLRSMIIPSPDCRFLSGDYSAIEARIVNWLAGQDDVLDLFRQYDAGDKTKDAYVVTAMRLFKLPFEKIRKFPERQTGKFSELGCGFGMGADTAVTQAKDQYGLILTLEDAQDIIADYRERHPAVVALWKELHSAAFRALANPGVPVEAANGKLRLMKSGSYLWMMLPSGRLLCYAHPRIVDQEMKWSTPEKPDIRPAIVARGMGKSKQWVPITLYGGLLTENAVQAIARDIMCDAMKRLDREQYQPVLSVHDEVLADTPLTVGSLPEFTALMQQVPDWAAGLPVAVESWEGMRYHK